ncbi:hypothetical protein P171DRAFT_26249 [Karstenula rhodostoma CBS 690.94]|uniref:Uncharacterized protein n=1 Tax=Karstenula rhodostoma CBS 690.94 TaxID=1392251 RepID=A0A9P4PFJ4_9PLEO|nr:hypothetical protein P171DRAFT_26249 [Karstenula rhodostoma CBS 690.94]
MVGQSTGRVHATATPSKQNTQGDEDVGTYRPIPVIAPGEDARVPQYHRPMSAPAHHLPQGPVLLPVHAQLQSQPGHPYPPSFYRTPYGYGSYGSWMPYTVPYSPFPPPVSPYIWPYPPHVPRMYGYPPAVGPPYQPAHPQVHVPAHIHAHVPPQEQVHEQAHLAITPQADQPTSAKRKSRSPSVADREPRAKFDEHQHLEQKNDQPPKRIKLEQTESSDTTTQPAEKKESSPNLARKLARELAREYIQTFLRQQLMDKAASATLARSEENRSKGKPGQEPSGLRRSGRLSVKKEVILGATPSKAD